MIVSWNWLSEYVRLDVSAEELTQRLALAGLNHESTEEVGGDLAIDLEVTSNRPDCLGHLGVAREIGVLFDRPMREPAPRPPETGPKVERGTAVEVQAPGECPYFTARVIRGVHDRESPWWLRKRLETIGVRPISGIVDITNYVLFECGQPLHAYDLDRLVKRRLVVRKAESGEVLRAINNRQYELSSDMLVIADAMRPVGLAGVMGGLDTEIGPETRSILIESAQFDAISVRKTARALGLFSPSSYRFERPMDPLRTLWASARCAELILEIAGGTLDEGAIEVGEPAGPRPPITLRFSQIPRILGITIDSFEVERILLALGLNREERDEKSISVSAPSWRGDLEREIDLIEEVARVHGYHHIPEDRAVPLTRSAKGERERVEDNLRDTLTGLGFDEAQTFSLVSDELAVPLEEREAGEVLRVEHSSRRKESALRRSLLPSLLQARGFNDARSNPDAWFFEIANVYLPRGEGALPEEPTRIAFVGGLDYLGAKGVVESILEGLHVQVEFTCRAARSPLFAEGRCAEVLLGGDSLGYVGEIDEVRRERLGVPTACAGAELDLGMLMRHALLIPRFRHIPAHPAISRDLSLVLGKEVAWAELASVVRQSAAELLESLEYLDAFEGGDIPAGQHSLHFGMRFRKSDRTLASEEADSLVSAVVSACQERFGARLRS